MVSMSAEVPWHYTIQTMQVEQAGKVLAVSDALRIPPVRHIVTMCKV